VSEHVQDRLSAYMDDALPALERRTVEDHLGRCAQCTHFLSELEGVDAAVRESTVAGPPGYFDTLPGRVRERLQKKRARPPAWTWAAVAAVVLFAMTPLLLRRQGVEAPAPPPAVAQKKEPATPSEPPRAEPLEAKALRAPLSQTKEKKAPADAEPVAQAESVKPFLPSAPKADRAAGAPQAAAPSVPAPLEAPEAQDLAEESRFAGKPRQEAPAAAGFAAPGTAARANAAAAKAQVPSWESRFQALRARTPTNATQAREVREAWRSLAEEAPSAVAGDDARFELVLAGRRAFQFSPSDLEIFRRDAEAYLSSGNSRHAQEVQRIVARLPS
jgi:hypothetical protein